MMRIANEDHTVEGIVSEISLIDWLMEGDPSIRWQVMADLTDSNPAEIESERRQVGDSGWGAQLLAYQEPSGRWGGGIYSPKWISTTYTLLALRFLGLPPGNLQARKGCQLLLERGFYTDGGINFFASIDISEACVTGIVLSILAYFRYPDDRIHELVTHLLGRQMADGGWNCQDHRGATHSSFHTTILALEGLLEYQSQQTSEVSRAGAIKTAQERAHEFLLRHRLFRSHRTGEIFDPRMLRFPFPPRWQYDTLRALDYFRKYHRQMEENAEKGIGDRGKGTGEAPEGRNKDARFEDAIDLIMKKRKPDGRWLAYQGPKGREFFEIERSGAPGRWNTLRALRVLRWWEDDL